MLPRFDVDTIAEHLRSVSAEVRLAPVRGEDASLAAEHVSVYLNGITSSRDGFLRLNDELARDTRLMCDADRFFSEAERESLHRVELLLREWAPRFASLRAPEDDPFVRSFPMWFRSYNDAITKTVRTMLDCAGALQERLADEAREDAEAGRWSARHARLTGDEETVSLDDLKKQSAGAA